MKMKTKQITYALLFLAVIGIGSCKKNSTTPASTTVNFTATLNGTSETPSNTSIATGTANFTYNTTTYILSGTVTFTGITPTGAHIHKGAVGVAGSVIFPLGSSPYTSPISFTSVALDATQRADLMVNSYYVNIHSIAFPAGEIRGQLIEQVSSSETYIY
jgi:hypothetical protein